FPVWRAISRVKRGELLAKVAELVEFYKQNLTWTISVETGKSLNESLAEVNEALHMCQYAASQGREPYGDVVASEIATKISYTMRKPR
ncbi:aldehyde dehydrogenase family protein, partial [Acinetobacter baumannii]